MRTLTLLIIYVLLTLLLIPIIIFCYVFRCAKPLIWAGKWAVSLAPRILGIRLEVSGTEAVENHKPCLYMSNHLSFLDGPLLFCIISQPVSVILKKEIFKIPVIGLGMKQVEFVPVDRKGIRGGKKSIDHASRLMKEKGFSFLIFPEGTRSLDGRLQKFRRGGFFLALAAQSPIVPISIRGTYELMPKGRFFVKKGTIEVVFHPPVPVHDYDRDNLAGLIEEVRGSIQSGLETAD